MLQKAITCTTLTQFANLRGEYSTSLWTIFLIMAFVFFLKLLISVASKADHPNLSCFQKHWQHQKTHTNSCAGNKLVSRLKSCFTGFLIELSTTNDWATLCSNDVTASFSFSYKKKIKIFLFEKGPHQKV